MELYHVLNRGVEKRDIFKDDSDRARFIHDLYSFNDGAPARNTGRILEDGSSSDIVRERLVDIHGWCLMGNHYHLLLSERAENGIPHFSRKLNVGYARYFNDKHERSGYLFQGRTRKVHIASDAHFLHILHYIHLNPLDFKSELSDWRGGRINNADEALNYLHTYRWSSYLDYCNIRNFPSILNKDLFAGVFRDYKKSLTAFLKDMDFSDEQPYLVE